MKQTTSTALAIPSKVQPKPTRAEIIDALTTIEIERIKAKQKQDSERKRALYEEIKKDLMDTHLKSPDQSPDYHFGYISSSNGKPYGIEIRFDINEPPKELVSKLKEYHELDKYLAQPDFQKIRKAIQFKMTGMEAKEVRVDRLLSDKDSRSALEEMLTKISE